MKVTLHILTYFALAGSILTGAARPALADMPTEQALIAELDSLRHGLEDGIQNADVERLLSFADPNIIVTWQNGQVSHGVEEVRTFFDRMLTGPNSYLSKIVMKPMAVESRLGIGEHIVSIGHMEEEYYVRNSGLHFTLNSRFTAWLSHESGKFLLRGIHLSGNVFDNPIQDLMVRKARMECGIGGLLLGVALTVLLCKMRGSKTS